MATTTIPLEKGTRDRLRSLGKKGETYDQILKRLMSVAEYEEFMERQYERLKDKKAFVSLDELWLRYEVKLHRSVVKYLKRLEPKFRERIKRALRGLRENSHEPRPGVDDCFECRNAWIALWNQIWNILKSAVSKRSVEALCLNANTKAKVTVGHVSIEVSNITFSRKFYEPVFKHLRFQVIMDQKDVLGLSNGLLSIFLAQPDSRRIERKEPKAEDFAIADHIALLVPDRKTVDEVTLVMKEAGFEPLFAPEEHPEFVPGYYSASFSDPDNNVIEFYVVQKS